jgi:hydroxymethylpyrimidine pyrophosphatase-like HAD family hydrolase
VLDLLGIAPENIAAFGDARNDLEMLQMAGSSFAMAAGDPRVIAAADTTIDRAEDELRTLLR